MHFTERNESLKYQELLALRRRLPEHHPSQHEIVKRIIPHEAGLHGEQYFDKITQPLLNPHCVNLRNITLFAFSEPIQIDSLFITPNFILICEIKNMVGSLFFDYKGGGMSRSISGVEEFFACPVTQVERHKDGLEQLLSEIGVRIPVIELVVYTNSKVKFTVKENELFLYQKIIRIEKLNRKIRQLYEIYPNKKLNMNELNHLKGLLLRKAVKPTRTPLLESLSISEKDIKTGVLCLSCHQRLLMVHGGWKCMTCFEGNGDAFQQSVMDYFILLKDYANTRELQLFLDMKSIRDTGERIKPLKLTKVGNQRPSIFQSPLHFVKKG
ncbi:nuclease-related domain-containing protein [Jeotgalibacillus aurantiacus]|uniref:nuclease-related domain-containing protein n=1 Tax=Jeotgalibacillus aurantiacus TaxID=2763266 RepID=UPI001D0A5BA8|nr:nuclease-related domain-containing protein [Jeotgalibacillus aurantiacus]